MVAGLEVPTSGSISLNGNIVKEPGRDRGMVFQEFALFPWRTVRKNIEFGPELSNVPLEKIREISDRFIELVGLKTFEDVHPKELSGGMKQRVGIARALANDPSILLMDEPFGSIDAQTRNLMQKELLRIWQTTKKTVMFVTHSVEEAVFLADKIIIMTARPGKVRETIEVPLARPRDRTSQEFIKIRARVLAELEEEFEKTQALEKAREK
jgi:NitT/TauT family transport system ATP-binding protein